MKKIKNASARVCFLIALSLFVLSVLIVLIANPDQPVPEVETKQEEQKVYDSSLSDASQINVVQETSAPTATPTCNSFDFDGRIVDGKVVSGEAAEETAQPTQKPVVNSFDFSGKIVDGKVVSGEAAEETAQPTQKPVVNSFDFSGKIVDGKVVGGEAAEETAQPTQKPVVNSFDFSGKIVDGKVVGGEAVQQTPDPTKASIMDQFDFKGTVQDGKISEAEPEVVEEDSQTEADVQEKGDGFFQKVGKFFKALFNGVEYIANEAHEYAGSIALAAFAFVVFGVISMVAYPIVKKFRRKSVDQKNKDASEKVREAYVSAPFVWLTYFVIIVIVVVIITWSSSSIEWKGFASKGSEVAYGIVYGITHPDMAYILSLGADKVPYLLLETIAIALLGTLIGGMIAIPVAFMASENVVPKWFAFIIRSVILAIRTIPSFVWALCWIRVTGPGAFCGVLTQSICSIGMISKMYITAIEDLDTKILESLDACGCTTFQKIRYGIIPQLTANFISTIIYRFDINLKDATTLGIVGAGGIGAALIQAISSRRWSIVGSFLFGMIILMMIIEYVSTKIRAKLARG